MPSDKLFIAIAPKSSINFPYYFWTENSISERFVYHGKGTYKEKGHPREEKHQEGEGMSV